MSGSTEPSLVPAVADAACAWLTTLRGDGSPHVTPVWFLLDEGTFWIASSTVNVKVVNLARFAAKYDGWDAADERQDGPRVMVEVRVDRWLLRPAARA